MDPPAPRLEWKQLMEYTFISEFELLKHAGSHRDITTEPWASPINREMTTKHFKIIRAHEEVTRLNIEAHRLRTSIRDEHQTFEHSIAQTRESDPSLAFKIQRLYNVRRRVNITHSRVLDDIDALPGFSGIRGPGVRCNIDVDHLQLPVELPADCNAEEDNWRQGDDTGAGDVGNGEPDDKIAEQLIDLTEAFAGNMRLVDGIPESMMFQWATFQ